jgi:(p)ppGpp synthase/HD superfamily hydrolase
MGYYAQTHLQLYRQLQDASYSQEDVVLVDRAYRLAMHIFAGYYRPNNKPFLVHLLGVASILVNARQPAAVIAAGLLHSAYLGRGRKATSIRRKRIAASLGTPVEQLIYAYSTHKWSVQDFRADDNLPSLAVEYRQLYLIKLADVHEEFLDGGHLYQPAKKLLSDQDNNSWLQHVARCLSALGHEEWASEFHEAVASNQGNIPEAARGTASASYVLAPGFSDSRVKNKLTQWLASIDLKS